MKARPPYVRPANDEPTRRVPRLVNAVWLVRALRDNARAAYKSQPLPWDDRDLYNRAATHLAQCADCLGRGE
jgi:hypothetical protein